MSEHGDNIAILLARIEMGISAGMAALEQAQEEMAAAVAAERERCAKIADGLSGDPYGTGRDIAAAIRARGAAGKD